VIVYKGVRDLVLEGQLGRLRILRLDSETRGVRPLDPRLDLYNHSPTGFEVGYGGSGPAQTALAILADHLGDDERAVRLHQAFKWAVIATLDRESDFELAAEDIDSWIFAHGASVRTIKFRYRQLGEHMHVDVFFAHRQGGTFAKAGELVMRPDEMKALADVLELGQIMVNGQRHLYGDGGGVNVEWEG
jgi:hypothetical protein